MRQLGAKVIITPKEGEQDIDSFILYHHLMIFMSSRTEPFLLEFDVMLTTGKGTGMVEKAKELAQARMVSMPPGKCATYTFYQTFSFIEKNAAENLFK